MTGVHRVMERYLPELRRYAFLLTGSKESGDRLVETCLTAAVERSAPIGNGREPRVAIFRLFHEINPEFRAAASQPRLAARGGLQERVLVQLLRLPEQQRAALILAGSLDFRDDEVGAILGLSAGRAREIRISARARLANAALAQILIIEDDFLIASELASIVQQTGREVCGPAATYAEALHCADQCEPALVLADVQLRDGQFAGIEAAHKIRQQHGAPVIFITAYPDRLTRASEFSPLTYLPKPFDSAAVRQTISNSLASVA